MHFSSGINRPPYEAYDAFLQITSGCSHRKCVFCSFYNDAKFRISPLEEVEEDIKEMASSPYKNYDRIYLQGADPFIASYDYLMKVADMIYKYLPNVKSIGGYARIDNLRNKSVSQLRTLAKRGFKNFYFGNESGDDFILKRMNKGYKAEDVIKNLRKLDEAGMPYIMNFLGGLGGHNYGDSHAVKSAEVINQLNPVMVYASELTLFPETPLSEELNTGKFEEATEEERYSELSVLVDNIKIPTVFKAEHVTLPVPIRCRLPEDRNKIQNLLNGLIDLAKSGKLDKFRENIFSL